MSASSQIAQSRPPMNTRRGGRGARGARGSGSRQPSTRSYTPLSQAEDITRNSTRSPYIPDGDATRGVSISPVVLPPNTSFVTIIDKFDDVYNDPKAEVILVARGGTKFRVSLWFLARRFDFFRDLRDLPPCDISEPIHPITTEISDFILRSIIQWLYGGPTHEQGLNFYLKLEPVTQLSAVNDFADKFGSRSLSWFVDAVIVQHIQAPTCWRFMLECMELGQDGWAQRAMAGLGELKPSSVYRVFNIAGMDYECDVRLTNSQQLSESQLARLMTLVSRHNDKRAHPPQPAWADVAAAFFRLEEPHKSSEAMHGSDQGVVTEICEELSGDGGSTMDKQT